MVNLFRFHLWFIYVVLYDRLPWIAPELYKNLTAVNIRTEVYSYGMTLWQTYEEGKNPVNHAFLTGRTVPEVSINSLSKVVT